MPHPHRLPNPFGHYQILRKLRPGGMGTVYQAQDTRLNCFVAIKVPHLMDPESVERFYREARFAQSLHHPYVCPVYELGRIDGIPYLTMPFIEGTPLDGLVGPDKVWEPRRAATLIRRLASALEALHRRKVLHRDLNPSNIMVRANDEPVLMDFGLARDLSGRLATLTLAGAQIGTPCYMAPEQIRGDPDSLGPATDVYGLGAVLYELLVGEPPFSAPSLHALYHQILDSSPAPPRTVRPDLDNGIAEICMRMLEKKVQDRFPSMVEVAASLGAYLSPRRRETTIRQRWKAGNKQGNPKKQCATPEMIPLLFGKGCKFSASQDNHLLELAHLRGVSKLGALDLSGCQGVTDCGLSQLRRLSGLRRLRLCFCDRVTDAGLSHLRGLSGVEELELGKCHITDAGLAHLRGLTGLKRLRLLFCERVTDAGLAHLRGMLGLKELDLGECSITDAGLAHLRDLAALQRLRLLFCKRITDAGLKVLKAALPQCHISTLR